jgi:hypothetical protein
MLFKEFLNAAYRETLNTNYDKHIFTHTLLLDSSKGSKYSCSYNNLHNYKNIDGNFGDINIFFRTIKVMNNLKFPYLIKIKDEKETKYIKIIINGKNLFENYR